MVNKLIEVLKDSLEVYVAVQSGGVRMESTISVESVSYENDTLTFGELGNSVHITEVSNFSIREDDNDWWLQYQDQLINIYPYF